MLPNLVCTKHDNIYYDGFIYAYHWCDSYFSVRMHTGALHNIQWFPSVCFRTQSAQNMIIFTMMDLYMHITGMIPIFRLGCIREHCIISSGFPPYASEPQHSWLQLVVQCYCVANVASQHRSQLPAGALQSSLVIVAQLMRSVVQCSVVQCSVENLSSTVASYAVTTVASYQCEAKI